MSVCTCVVCVFVCVPQTTAREQVCLFVCCLFVHVLSVCLFHSGTGVPVCVLSVCTCVVCVFVPLRDRCACMCVVCLYMCCLCVCSTQGQVCLYVCCLCVCLFLKPLLRDRCVCIIMCLCVFLCLSVYLRVVCVLVCFSNHYSGTGKSVCTLCLRVISILCHFQVFPVSLIFSPSSSRLPLHIFASPSFFPFYSSSDSLSLLLPPSLSF